MDVGQHVHHAAAYDGDGERELHEGAVGGALPPVPLFLRVQVVERLVPVGAGLLVQRVVDQRGRVGFGFDQGRAGVTLRAPRRGFHHVRHRPSILAPTPPPRASPLSSSPASAALRRAPTRFARQCLSVVAVRRPSRTHRPRHHRCVFVVILRCASAGSYSLRSAMPRAPLRCAGQAGRTGLRWVQPLRRATTAVPLKAAWAKIDIPSRPVRCAHVPAMRPNMNSPGICRGWKCTEREEQRRQPRGPGRRSNGPGSSASAAHGRTAPR